MCRQFTIVAFSALLAVALALAGAPVFARGGGGGGGHGGGGGGRGGGGGGGFRGGGGGFRGGGGGGGVRGYSGGARSFSAPRMPSYGGARGGYGMAAPRMPGYGGVRGGTVMRAPGSGAGGLSLTHANVGMGNRYGIGARPAIGSLGNRSNVGNFRSFGNTGFRGVTGAAGIAGGNRAVAFNNNIVNRSSNLNAFRSGGFGAGLGYRGFGNGWRNPYYGFHQGWLGGYWGGYYPWGFGYGWGLGYGLGWGLGYGGYGLGWGLWNWPYGSALYDYGYMPYSNAYYGPSTIVAGPYDYAQPIDPTLSPPPTNAATDEALALFGSARDAFKQGSFESALQLANEALAKTPNDTALHEFRALCLFALGRYDEAATTLYAVLSVGPGWDWSTLIGLYPGIDPYTTQLRALESDCVAHPQSAAARFVLAYHYLSEGHLDAAAAVLRQVIALKPDDTISANLLRQIEAAKAGGGAAASPAPATAPTPAPANTTPPAGATIHGTWTAHPAPDTSITLTIRPDGTFQWQVDQKGKPQQFSGTSTFGGGVLTLAQDKGPVLVGRVSWKDPTHMTFRIAGGPPDDPGLSFSR